MDKEDGQPDINNGEVQVTYFKYVRVSEKELFKMTKEKFEKYTAYILSGDDTDMLDWAITFSNGQFRIFPDITVMPNEWDEISHINLFYRAILERVMKDDVLSNCGIIYHEDENHYNLVLSYLVEYESLWPKCRQLHSRLNKIKRLICHLDLKKDSVQDKLFNSDPIHITKTI